MLKVSIGIPAYNEEANIGRLLEKLLAQEEKTIKISEIIVIASGCTDGTEEIVKEFAKKDRRIKLLVKKEREGKTKADNLFISKAREEILVLACADILPKRDCFENLVPPFANPEIGVTASRMIPLNDKESLPGYFSHLWWRLFDRVAVDYFRAGEIMAFRKLAKRIPQEIGADEVYLTDRIMSQGYQGKYIVSAVANNMGPKTIREAIRMRRRHACHHFQFLSFGPKVYYPKTMDNFYVFRLFLKEVNWFSLKEAILGILSALLEGFSRLLAYFDFYSQKKYRVWPRSGSTKKL